MQMKRTAGLPLLLIVIAFIAGWVAGTYLPVPFLPKAQPPASALAAAPTSLPFSAGAPAAPSSSSSPLLPSSLLASIPDVRQSTGYTCGASVLQAILAYWGTEEREDRLAARLHSTPEAGTHPLDIVRVAREFGLTAELRDGLDRRSRAPSPTARRSSSICRPGATAPISPGRRPGTTVIT
jgi:hypothetical protein